MRSKCVRVRGYVIYLSGKSKVYTFYVRNSSSLCITQFKFHQRKEALAVFNYTVRFLQALERTDRQTYNEKMLPIGHAIGARNGWFNG